MGTRYINQGRLQHMTSTLPSSSLIILSKSIEEYTQLSQLFTLKCFLISAILASLLFVVVKYGKGIKDSNTFVLLTPIFLFVLALTLAITLLPAYDAEIHPAYYLEAIELLLRVIGVVVFPVLLIKVVTPLAALLSLWGCMTFHFEAALVKGYFQALVRRLTFLVGFTIIMHVLIENPIILYEPIVAIVSMTK